MYQISADEMMFFNNQLVALPIYEAFAERLFVLYPDTKMKVQKSQITYSNRHVYACVSFVKVKKKVELPTAYFVLTLGLSYPLDSYRVAVKTEPYPGRWTTHIVVGSKEELDAELFTWLQQAYDFAQYK